MDEHFQEVSVAMDAVRMAAELCQRVRRDAGGGESILKLDRSPVTIADYGSQALICKRIREHFPADAIVAEEDSKELRKPERASLLKQVTRYVAGLIPGASAEEVSSWIDYGSQRPAKRFWTLDPIDGTKGFLRGDQYAIALALIEEDEVRLGLMACPNLPIERGRAEGKKGCLFLAMRGGGSFQMNLQGGGRERLSVSRCDDPQQAILAESVEPDHSDHLFHQRVAQRLRIQSPPLQMDSQAKYAIVARGEATLYLRVPSPSEPDYVEKIWDHAAGSIIAEEAGGRVTDILGNRLDFSSGIMMVKNKGIVVTNGRLHDVVLNALKMG